MRKFFLSSVLGFALSFCFQNTSVAQDLMRDSVFVANLQRGIHAAYDMRFGEADRFVAELERKYPQHPVGPFLKSLTKWWRILSDIGDVSIDDDFHDEMTDVSKRCDRILSRNPKSYDAVLFKGMAVGFRSRLYANRSSWVRSFKYGKEAVDYVQRAAEIAPENNDYYLGWGTYDYFAAVLPTKYSAMKYAMWFLPRGSRERGLEEIKRTFNHGSFMRAEAAYYLFQINYVYEPRYDGAKFYIGWLRQRYPNNAFYHLLSARLDNYFARHREAEEQFKEIIQRYLRRANGYSTPIAEQAYYYLSGLYLFSNRYEEARDVTTKLLMLSNKKKASDYQIMGRLRMGMIYDVLGNREKAKEMYRMVLQQRDVQQVHGRAKAFLQTPYRRSS